MRLIPYPLSWSKMPSFHRLPIGTALCRQRFERWRSHSIFMARNTRVVEDAGPSPGVPSAALVDAPALTLTIGEGAVSSACSPQAS